MLKSLNLYNFIIIDNLDLTFTKGFTIFTGETGAGKSIILEAIALTLGAKATPELIKEGKDKSTIIAVYHVNSKIIDILKDYEVDIENNEIIIRRIINKVGGSKAFINDVPVSVNLLKTLSSLIIDIHCQFDNQKLLKTNFHLELLDNFVNLEILSLTAKNYKTYKTALLDYNNLVDKLNNIANEREYLTYVLEELQQADVKENEELELIEQRSLCLQQERIKESLKQVDLIFNKENNILHTINITLKKLDALKEVLGANVNYSSLVEKLNNCYSDLLDSESLVDELKTVFINEDLNLDNIEERLHLIRTLSKKHKVNSTYLPKLVIEFSKKLNTLQEGENILSTKLTLLNDAKIVYQKSANALNKARQEAALFLSDRVNKELIDLHLKTVKFSVDINSSPLEVSEYSALGFDKVVFKITNNLNEEAKELQKVASGGELARIMLAIKVVIAEKAPPLLAVFDEIDVGVGGEVAHSIGQKLKFLATFTQVLVITHSHQVAALADHHYKVSKNVNTNACVNTYVDILNFDSRVLEIARMMSANKITSNAKAIAISLLQQN